MKRYVMPLMLLLALPAMAQKLPLLEQKEAIEKLPADQKATALAAFVTRVESEYGSSVLAALATADTPDAGSPMDVNSPEGKIAKAKVVAARQRIEAQVLSEMYLDGTLGEGGKATIQWRYLPVQDREEVINFIAAKPVLTQDDMRAVEEFTRQGERWPQLIPRKADILALYPENEMARYTMKYKKLTGGVVGFGEIHTVMSNEELMKVTTGVLSDKVYALIRAEVLARATGAVRRKLRDENLAGNTDAFNTAMAPIVAALNAPQWQGLQEATEGLDVSFPAQNYAELATKMAHVVAQLDNGTYKTAKTSSGSLMLLKGTTEYNSWAAQYESE
jgi:hypothetical protein